MIDDFEDEQINDLTLIEKTYNEVSKKYPECKDIIRMFHTALEHKTSIHFYF